MSKGYDLTKAPNDGVKDKAPDWMNDLFTKLEKPQDQRKKQHPFEGIDDPILNPKRIGLKNNN